MASFDGMAPRMVKKRIDGGDRVELIDVRTPVEFREIHATDARLVPLDSLDPVALLGGGNGSRPVCFICKSGQRARKAAEKCAAAGFAGVAYVEGGTEAWAAAGLPVVRGRKAMSLERQVRIAAGSLVLAGVILAALVHPYFAAVSAFVGAGLVFAGVTDTCGMGLMLAKMPWNRLPADDPACAP